MNDPVIEYRPNVWLGLFLAAINLVTVPLLIWIALNLGPKAVAAMDGFNKILFSVVPIPLFASVAAVGFLFLGCLIAKRSLRSDPTLIISVDGLRLPSGESVPWEELESTKHKKTQFGGEHLVITLRRGGEMESATVAAREHGAKRLWRKWFGRGQSRKKWEISQFELGAELATVLSEIDQRRIGNDSAPTCEPEPTGASTTACDAGG